MTFDGSPYTQGPKATGEIKGPLGEPIPYEMWDSADMTRCLRNTDQPCHCQHCDQDRTALIIDRHDEEDDQ